MHKGVASYTYRYSYRVDSVQLIFESYTTFFFQGVTAMRKDFHELLHEPLLKTANGSISAIVR